MNDRKGFGSNFGFLMAAVGSAVGLGNIWGFPNKMGANGGFPFLILYLALALCCGVIIMLGELALVPKESPINRCGLLFYNTLFDENACCHVAAGAGFSEVLDGFMDMSDEEILAKGVNDSLIHVDFMVGSDDLHIVGIHEDGSETDVFVNGTWAE